MPAYRKVAAPLQIDGVAGWTQFKRKHMPPRALPEFARDSIKEEVRFSQRADDMEEAGKVDGIAYDPDFS